MKKLLSLLLVISLCLCSAAALAEEEIPSITLEPSYEGRYHPLGDTGLLLYMPSDWLLPTEQPQAPVLAAFAEPDQKAILGVIMLETSIEDLYAQFDAQVNSGSLASMQIISINGIDYLATSTYDMAESAAYLPLDEETTLLFLYQINDPNFLLKPTSLEILGTLSIAEPEDDAETVAE